MARVYSNLGIVELERLTGQYWDSDADLSVLDDELRFRTTARAKKLKQKIQKRLAELGGGHKKRSSESSGDQNAGRDDGTHNDSREDLLFREVGLHTGAPAFLIKAARKAFRTHYHPDRIMAEAEKRHAEERFKHFDSIFDAIEQLQS